MKLNYRNTIYIGIIFFIISLFWYTYDMMIARTLIDKYGLNQTWSGIVMALDNVMAVILLPLFGALSDKSTNKLGKRTPYIIIGTLLSAVAFMALAYPDYIQTKKIHETDIIEEHYNIAFDSVENTKSVDHWYIVIDNMARERQRSFDLGLISLVELNEWNDEINRPIINVLESSESELSTRDLSVVKDLYYRYLSNRTWEVTKTDLSNLLTFGSILFVGLFAMTIYRSPAIALMPDVTCKPLRSKANAVITLMGAFGGVVAIYVIMINGMRKGSYDYHGSVYILTGILMIIALGFFLWKVNEPKLLANKKNKDREFDLSDEVFEKSGTSLISAAQRRKTVYILLVTVFLLFMGHNAVTSKMADYFPKVLNINFFDIEFVVAQIVILLLIIPVGLFSMFAGRKKTVIIGMVILTISFYSISLLHQNQAWLAASLVATAGVGVLMVSINMYVMVIEMSQGEVGKYTGYYYLAAMSAQIVTPFLSGVMMDELGRISLFPYATIFILLALATMLFTKDVSSYKKV